MTLRRKTLVFVLGSLALLVGAILLVVYTLVARGFEQAEEQLMHDRVARVKSLVRTMIDEHTRRFVDWSQWDDCAEFLRDENPEWVESNLTAEAVANLGVDMVIVARADGARPFAAMFDAESATLVDLPAELEPYLDRKFLLRGIDEHGPGEGHIVMLANKPFIFSSQPILATDGTPPPIGGRLMFAKHIDETWIRRLEAFTFLDVQVHVREGMADSGDASELQTAVGVLESGQSTFVRKDEKKTNLLCGFALLEDIRGQSTMLLHVERKTTTAQRIASVMSSIVYALAACGLIVALLSLRGVRHAVIAPMERLLVGVRELEAGRAADVSITTGDEMQGLAESFNRMALVIREREASLVEAHHQIAQLFDNLRQGVLAFDSAGRVVGETSRRALEIFRLPSLAGADVVHLLYGEREEWDLERQAFADWPAAACATAPGDWSEIQSAAPKELVLGAGTDDERHLELEFQPIRVGERIERVLMLVTDQTETFRLRAEQQASEAEHAQQIEAMRRRLSSGPHLYAQFLRQTRERVERIRTLHGVEADEAFRLAHTVKGEARLFDLADLEHAANDLEQSLLEERDGRANDESQSRVAASLEASRVALETAEAIFVSASPIGSDVLDQVPVQRGDIDSLAEVVLGIADQFDSNALSNLRRITERLAARPFGELCASLAEQAPVWASRRGKQVAVEVVGREVRIPTALAEVLVGALTHLLRNSISHGIEEVEERESGGKDLIGRVSVTATDSEHGPRVVVQDDGRGVDLAAVERKARQLGLDVVAGRELELLFEDRFSTAERVDELSGRGVGLSAVRADLARVGYQVEIESRPGQGTRFCLLPRALTLAAT